MSRIGRSEISHGEILSVDEVLARTDAVSRQDAEAVAQEVLGRPMALAVIGPFEEGALPEGLTAEIAAGPAPLEAAAHVGGSR
jgi:hypothetical protein